MSANGAIRRSVVITNPRGLHPRGVIPFVKACQSFKATITVWSGEKRADGRSIWDLIGLAAEPGTVLILELDGDDAAEAVGPLGELLESPGSDDD
jgi:phosphotransferase system HPr (HPr) family protein